MNGTPLQKTSHINAWHSNARLLNARLLNYGLIGVGLAALGIVLQPTDWKGSGELHTLMELAAMLTAFMVGVVALLRFHTKKSNTYLFLGIGFLGTAFLDGYHAVITSSFFAEYLPSGLATLIPWSWNASRTFLSLLMAISWWAWRRESRLGEAGRIPEKWVYSLVAVMTGATFLFFTIAPLPRAYYPELFFGRPEEFVAAALFGIALVGYLQKAQWRTDALENWIVISLVIAFVSQAVMMSRSFVLFDAMFDLAHFLKIVSYASVLTGLLINMHLLFVHERQATEQLSQAQHLESIGQLAAGIAHEINSPMQYICSNIDYLKLATTRLMDMVKLYSECLGDKASPLSWSERVEKIQEANKRLQFDTINHQVMQAINEAEEGSKRVIGIVRAMKDFSHPGTKDKTFSDINQALRSSAAIANNRWKYVAELEFELDPHLPHVLCLPAEINQVFLNLILNATDAIAESSNDDTHLGLITVRTRHVDEMAVIEIEDSGCGMPPEVRERIFEPFFTTKEVGKGTGQGLAICYNVTVNKHGGTISVESQPGLGTTFSVSLPIGEEQLAVNEPEPPPEDKFDELGNEIGEDLGNELLELLTK